MGMEKSICNQIPLNTEIRNIKTIGKRNNTFYCPDSFPFICGYGTVNGKEMKDKGDVYCVKSSNDCNYNGKPKTMENQPFFFQEDGFITEKKKCESLDYSVFNINPPKTPI